MKREHHPIDDFFREELEGYSIPPSEKAREAFLKEAETAGSNSPANRRWIYTLLGLFLVSIILGLVFLYPENEPFRGKTTEIEAPVSTPATSGQPASSQPAPPRSAEPAATPGAAESPVDTHHPAVLSMPPAIKENQPGKAQLTASQPDPGNPGLASSSATNLQAPVAEVLSSPVPLTSSVSNQGGINAPINADTIVANPAAQPLPPPAGAGDSTKKMDPPVGKEKKHPSSNNRKWDLVIGVQYSPEWMMNTLEGTKFVNNAGLEGTFQIGRYSITTGLGISVSKGTNELAVAYNDYLGSYQKLDSMTFEWDERHYYLLPTYFMTEKDVWDSLMKLENAKIVNQYTYLQVPLIFGYDFLVKEKFSMGARIGPILSLLLNTKKISGDYDPGMKQIISINEITPEQVQTNWQVMAGITATYRVNRWLSLEVEPFGKYYFNSVYEPRNSSQKPWSVGIRTALRFNFLR
jgi:hypothetical protein